MEEETFTREKRHTAPIREEKNIRRDIIKRDPNSALHNHCQKVHQGHKIQFQMDIKGTFHKDSFHQQRN